MERVMLLMTGMWYVVYADPETKYLEAAAYIVTANKTLKKQKKIRMQLNMIIISWLMECH